MNMLLELIRGRSRQGRSPLKGKPLRFPGQSVQEKLESELFDKFFPTFLFALFFSTMAYIEWFAAWRQMPRQPWLYTAVAILAVLWCGWKYIKLRRAVIRLSLGRDGERLVGEHLERLRFDGAHVFHDIPGENFNLDHVVLSQHGFFVVETKTRTKPRHRDARIELKDAGICVAGQKPDSHAITQAQAGARWLGALLEEVAGKRFSVRGVVLFPGWFVEPMDSAWRSGGLPWVLEPKALASFISHEPLRYSDADVKLAAANLSRYVRAKEARC